ncbi:hypothetical protein D3C72_177410 [compost metagenome]
MPDRAMGYTPEPPVEELAQQGDPTLPLKDDQLKQCGDLVPIGRGEPTYPDRNEAHDLPVMAPPLERRMLEEEAIIQALQAGAAGSLPCQADPDCGEPFSPPVDVPFGDILAEARCDPPPSEEDPKK